MSGLSGYSQWEVQQTDVKLVELNELTRLNPYVERAAIRLGAERSLDERVCYITRQGMLLADYACILGIIHGQGDVFCT